MGIIRNALLGATITLAGLLSNNTYALNTIVLHDRGDIVAEINSPPKVFNMKDICDKYNGGQPAKFLGTGGTPGYINKTMKDLLKQSSVTLDDVLEPTVPLLSINEIVWAPNCELRKVIIEFLPGGAGPGPMGLNCTLGDSIFYTTDNYMNGVQINNFRVVEDNIFIGFGMGLESSIYAPDTPCGAKYNLFAWNSNGIIVHYGINMEGAKNIFYRNINWNAAINMAKSTSPSTAAGYVFTLDDQDWYDKNGNFLTDKSLIGQTVNPPLTAKAGETFTINTFGYIESTSSDLDYNGMPDLDDNEGLWNCNPQQDLTTYGYEVVNAEDPDNDGDGILDEDEIKNHTDPLDPLSPGPNPPKVPFSTASALLAGAGILYLGRRRLRQETIDSTVGSNMYTKKD